MGTWGVHYTIPFGYAFEIFQSERLKKQKKQTKNPKTLQNTLVGYSK